ncbi:hypothetical protein IJ750_03610 [bacterium]|nr:hypothetical protein [bacterium]MBR1776144.1 hypothetical protein [bacterium]
MTNIDTKIQHEVVQNAQFEAAQNANRQHAEKNNVKGYNFEDNGAVLNDVGKEIEVFEPAEEISDFEDSSQELKFKIVQEPKETLRATANQEPNVVKELLTGVA